MRQENASKTAVNEISKTRNKSLDIVKFIAACFVVFIHIRFAGDLGKIMECLARFSVPFFFAISGYYAFQADSGIVRKRMFRMLKITLIASALFLIWGLISNGGGYNTGPLDYLSQRFSAFALCRWFFLDYNPFGGHLWFLSALFFTYLLFYLYVKLCEKKGKTDYRFLYCAGAAFLVIHIVLGTFFMAAGHTVSFIVYRNTLLFAFPMFMMGLFLREHQERILERFHLTGIKTVVIVLIGIGLSLLQRFGIGETELPLGTILEVAAVIVFITSLQQKGSAKGAAVAKVLGKASLFIYVLHPLYDSILRYYAPDSGLLKSGVYPLLLMLFSALMGILFALVQIKCDKIIRQRKSKGKTI